MKKNVTLMSPSAVSDYVTELEDLVDVHEAVLDEQFASLDAATEHIVMLEEVFAEGLQEKVVKKK